jgi:hypothetical protein
MKRKTDRKPPREAQVFMVYTGDRAYPWAAAYQRRDAIREYERTTERTWAEAKADGYRCVRVRMVPEGAAPAWDWRLFAASGIGVFIGFCGPYSGIAQGNGVWALSNEHGEEIASGKEKNTEKARAACEAALAAHLAQKGGKP